MLACWHFQETYEVTVLAVPIGQTLLIRIVEAQWAASNENASFQPRVSAFFRPFGLAKALEEAESLAAAAISQASSTAVMSRNLRIISQSSIAHITGFKACLKVCMLEYPVL